MRNIIIFLTMVLLFINLAFAFDYYYTPMNFDSQQNHSFNITASGQINVTLPSNFNLVSGSLTGNDTLFFIFSSPNITNDEPDVFTGQIYVNGTFQENYYMLYADDSKIVDLKIELGHGDFNYLDSDSYIGTDPTLLFNLVRVWAMGSDIIGEPATDVRFNCSFPDIIPNTVDSKYTTTYNPTNITAFGELSRMEGMSLFRVFVLSQEVELSDGESYIVECDTLYYDFEHTTVIADIPNINLTADSLEPLVISKVDGDSSVLYTILNNGSYDIRDIQFLFSSGSGTVRYELDELLVGDFIQIALSTDDSGNITTDARFVPEWMFNSRSPTYYYQENIEAYTTTNPFYNINSSLYFINHTLVTDSVYETQDLEFSIDFLQSPLYGTEYTILYEFYEDSGSGALVWEQLVQVQGNGSKTIIYQSPDVYISGIEEEFEVIATVSMEDVSGVLQEFPQETLGLLTIGKLTNNAPIIPLLNTPSEDVSILQPNINKITGATIGISSLLEGYWLIIFIGLIFFLFLWGLLTKKKKRKKSNFSEKQPIYP